MKVPINSPQVDELDVIVETELNIVYLQILKTRE